MYGIDKNFAAPHTGIVLAISDLIAPVVFTLATLLVTGIRKTFSMLTVSRMPRKQAEAVAPYVALVTVPGNFITSAFKTW